MSVSPVSSILTDPGPLCPGVTTVLTCNVTRGDIQIWGYDGMRVARTSIGDITQPVSPVQVGGITFSIRVLSFDPNLASQLSFNASVVMEGRIISCDTLLINTTAVLRNILLQFISMYLCINNRMGYNVYNNREETQRKLTKPSLLIRYVYT